MKAVAFWLGCGWDRRYQVNVHTIIFCIASQNTEPTLGVLPEQQSPGRSQRQAGNFLPPNDRSSQGQFSTPDGIVPDPTKTVCSRTEHAHAIRQAAMSACSGVACLVASIPDRSRSNKKRGQQHVTVVGEQRKSAVGGYDKQGCRTHTH